MADIIVKKVRTTQPQQPVNIDWSNPITLGLVASSSPNTRSYTNGRVVLPLATGTGSIRYADNEVLRQSVVQSSMPALKNAPGSTSSLTVLSVFVPGNEIAERGLGQLGQGFNAHSAGILVGDGTTAGKVRFRVYLGGARYIGSSQADLTRPNVAIATHTYNSKQELWLNGVKDASTGSFTGASPGYGFYGHNVSSGQTALALNAVWDRALTDAEIKSLSENPWQVFAPEERIISFDSAVTGGKAVDLVGANLVQTDSISSGTITQTHVLVGQGLATIPSIASGTITQSHVLTGTHLTQSDGVSSGSITQTHVLTGQNLTQDSIVSNGIVSQIHALNGQGLSQTDTVTNGVISTSITLSASNLSQTDTVSNGVITQAINVSGYNLAQSDSVSISVSLSQTHKLTAQNVTQNDVIGSGSISIGELKTGRDFLNSVFYVPSPTPNNTGDLARYLTNELQMIQTAIMQLAAGHIDVTNVAPAKPREGDLRLCDGVNWNPVGLGKRFVGYRGNTWVDLG